MQISRLVLIVALLFSASAQAFNLIPSKWPQGTTTMYLGDLTGNAPSGESWRGAFTEAASAWNNPSNFHFNLSDAIVPGNCADNAQNYVAFTDTICGDAFGSSTLAVTAIFVIPATPSVMAKTDILFNNAISWNIYHGQTGQTTDFRRVAVHELGHALGLDHETTADAIMTPSLGNIELPTIDDLSGVVAHYGNPDNNPAIILTLETPAQNGTLSGIGNVQGWVVSQVALQEAKLFIDGSFVANIPFGGSRLDVGNAFPQYPNSANAGFSMAYAYSGATPGTHTALVRVVDINGNIQEASATFVTVRFGNLEFFSDPNKVDLRNASSRFPEPNELGYQMIIDNARIDGKAYSILLLWNTASQKFEIHSITP